MPSMSDARSANRSPRNPAKTVVTQLVACRENASVPSCVPLSPQPYLDLGEKYGLQR